MSTAYTETSTQLSSTQRQTTSLQTRLLVSLKEASCLIGSQGSKIEKIKAANNVNCKLTATMPKCSDRVLIVSTPPQSTTAANNTYTENVQELQANMPTFQGINAAIGDFLQILVEEMPLDAKSNQAKLYNYGPLNHIMPLPDKCSHLGYLRLILNDSQISIIIGEGGSRIKGLLAKYEDSVRMVASKNYLPNSDDRIFEIQGEPAYVVAMLNDIDTLLMETSGTINNVFESELFDENLESTETSNTESGNYKQRTKKHYAPHFNYSRTFNIPNEYVGIMIGKNRNRINSLQNHTNTSIVVSKEQEDSPTRTFTITSTDEQQVERALKLLKSNYNKIEKTEYY
ncbi:hypothetical protein ACO0QE_003323 [Hanseniaspora vineae]